MKKERNHFKECHKCEFNNKCSPKCITCQSDKTYKVRSLCRSNIKTVSLDAITNEKYSDYNVTGETPDLQPIETAEIPCHFCEFDEQPEQDKYALPLEHSLAIIKQWAKMRGHSETQIKVLCNMLHPGRTRQDVAKIVNLSDKSIFKILDIIAHDNKRIQRVFNIKKGRKKND